MAWVGAGRTAYHAHGESTGARSGHVEYDNRGRTSVRKRSEETKVLGNAWRRWNPVSQSKEQWVTPMDAPHE